MLNFMLLIFSTVLFVIHKLKKLRNLRKRKDVVKGEERDSDRKTRKRMVKENNQKRRGREQERKQRRKLKMEPIMMKTLMLAKNGNH